MFLNSKSSLSELDSLKFKQDEIAERWKLNRIKELEQVKVQHRHYLSELSSFWHQSSWLDELRYGLKPYSRLALSYHMIHLIRKVLYMAILFLPIENA